MSRMKTSEVYKYTGYLGLGVFAAVTLNELANIVTIPTELNCLYCVPSLVGVFVFYAITSNARWMSGK